MHSYCYYIAAEAPHTMHYVKQARQLTKQECGRHPDYSLKVFFYYDVLASRYN